MLTSKQRKTLLSLASAQSPITQIGKQGITENLINSLSDALEKRELIKVSVLNNAAKTCQEYSVELSAATKSEIVSCIGKKIILYRRSQKENAKHIEL